LNEGYTKNAFRFVKNFVGKITKKGFKKLKKLIIKSEEIFDIGKITENLIKKNF